MTLRVMLADDHEIVREGLKNLLVKHDFDVVGEAGDGHEARQLAAELRPDIAILDYSMPRLNGIEAAREVRRACPSVKVILLTMHAEDRYVLEALRAGVSGYVVKIQAASDLIRAIHEVSRGRTSLSPIVARSVVDACLTHSELPADPLTAKERQVLLLIADGKRTKEIATLLGISVKTAESHRTRIMEKLDIHETAGLVRYAIRQCMVEP
jgi:two-component system response regulator NreC